MKGKNQRQLGSDHAKAVTTDCRNCQFPGERQKSTHLQPNGTERKTGLKDVVKPTSGGAPTHLQLCNRAGNRPQRRSKTHVWRRSDTSATERKTGLKPTSGGAPSGKQASCEWHSNPCLHAHPTSIFFHFLPFAIRLSDQA